MALGIVSNAIYAPDKPAKPGYDLPAAPSPAGPAAPEERLPALLAKADPVKGQSNAKACQACHSFEKGGPAKVGPPLHGVVGRPIASIPGFAYSDTLKSIGGEWTYDRIFAFIKNPKGMASGTKMSYVGELDAKKRADILAYLRTLSDNPVPFPQ